MLHRIRELYNEAHLEEAICTSLINVCTQQPLPVIKGYLAGATMISTKYIKNPFKIITIFNAAKHDLEELISENFDEVELRYIRYSIQKNTPRFVGYYRNMEDDRNILVKFIQDSADSDLKAHVLLYLRATNDVADIG